MQSANSGDGVDMRGSDYPRFQWDIAEDIGMPCYKERQYPDSFIVQTPPTHFKKNINNDNPRLLQTPRLRPPPPGAGHARRLRLGGLRQRRPKRPPRLPQHPHAPRRAKSPPRSPRRPLCLPQLAHQRYQQARLRAQRPRTRLRLLPRGTVSAARVR